MQTLASDPEVIRSLQMHGTSVYCHRDRVLFEEGDTPSGVYILNRGEATLSANFSVSGVVVSIVKTSKAMLGLPGAMYAKPHAMGAVAHSGAHLSFVTQHDFTALIQSDAALYLKVLQMFAAEVEFARREVLLPLRICAENASWSLPHNPACAFVAIPIPVGQGPSAMHRSTRR
jgi:CRP-like cAMP-binding protein